MTTGHAFGPAAATQAAEKMLDALYATVPDVACKGLCAEACGPIGMTPVERARIVREHGVFIGHAETKPGTLECPALQGNRCTVYSTRPMICRIFGAVEGMPCPHGCEPAGGRRSDAFGAQMLRAADAFGG